MYRLKSVIILKYSIYLSDTDKHSELLEELEIENNEENAKTLFVKAKLFPINEDIFTSVEEWEFKIDQDILPDWYISDYDEKRVRQAVGAWYKEHVFINVNGLRFENKKQLFFKDCQDIILVNSTSTHWGNSESTHFDNSTSEHWGNSESTHFENSTSKHWDNSTSTHFDDSESTHFDNSTSEHWGNSRSKHYGNSTSEHFDDSTSKHWGNSRSKHYGNSISTHRDNSKSKHWDNSTSTHFDDSESKHWDNSTSEHCGKSRSTHWGNSTAILPTYNATNKENIKLFENATLKDLKIEVVK